VRLQRGQNLAVECFAVGEATMFDYKSVDSVAPGALEADGIMAI